MEILRSFYLKNARTNQQKKLFESRVENEVISYLHPLR
jgi:hypothetical protein